MDMRKIPYSKQEVSADDIAAVAAILQSAWLTQGPAVRGFEDRVAGFCGASHAVAVCNGTAALHLACRALGLGAGDWLWTSPITFIASANCALYCGAQVDFVDIDPRTYNLDVAALAGRLEEARRANRLPKILVAVHFAGQPCDMAAIAELAKQYGFAVVEDAAHALGARYRDRAVGSCDHSDAAVFSFHPVKAITTGEGGMIVTNRADLHSKAHLLRSHGITNDPALMESPSEGPWYYQQIDLGLNYRLTDIQAALGTSQMARLHDFVERRRALARNYDAALADLPLVRPWEDPQSRSAYHLYVVRLRLQDLTRSRRAILESMRAEGIEAHVHYIPVHLQPFYQRLGFRRGAFPVAEAYYEEAMTLPLFPSLSEGEQQWVVDALRRHLR